MVQLRLQERAVTGQHVSLRLGDVESYQVAGVCSNVRPYRESGMSQGRVGHGVSAMPEGILKEGGCLVLGTLQVLDLILEEETKGRRFG